MFNLKISIAVGIGGFIGALLRFYVSEGVARVSGEDYRFFGTMTVNLLGCFVIGVLTTVAARSTHISPVIQKCLITGLLGSLTTFSTFAVESLALLQDGRFGAVAFKIGVSLIVGLLLVSAGAMTAGAFMASEA